MAVTGVIVQKGRPSGVQQPGVYAGADSAPEPATWQWNPWLWAKTKVLGEERFPFWVYLHKGPLWSSILPEAVLVSVVQIVMKPEMDSCSLCLWSVP